MPETKLSLCARPRWVRGAEKIVTAESFLCKIQGEASRTPFPKSHAVSSELLRDIFNWLNVRRENNWFIAHVADVSSKGGLLKVKYLSSRIERSLRVVERRRRNGSLMFPVLSVSLGSLNHIVRQQDLLST